MGDLSLEDQLTCGIPEVGLDARPTMPNRINHKMTQEDKKRWGSVGYVDGHCRAFRVGLLASPPFHDPRVAPLY